MATTPSVGLIDRMGHHTLTTFFVDYVDQAAAALGLPEDCVSISAIELSAALEEAQKDLDIMASRRKPGKGLSWGKVAGTLWFRLMRYRIVNIHDLDKVPDAKLADKRKFYRLQDIAVYKLVFSRVLRVESPQKLMSELLYLSARRHVNQEMLGAILDVVRANDA